MVNDIDAWGAPHRHYADPVFDADRIYLDEAWKRTVEIVAPGSENAVERAVRAWNQRVRNQLSAEIGFQLKGRQVRVRVIDGLPEPLSEVLGPA